MVAVVWPSLGAPPTPPRLLPQQLRQRFVAQPAAGRDGVGIMILPSVRRFLAERAGHSHLRHHGGAAARAQGAIGKQDTGTVARRLDRRIHPGGAGADDQHVGVDVSRFGGHGVVWVANAAASFAANCRSISFALERSTGWPSLPSLPAKAASTS